MIHYQTERGDNKMKKIIYVMLIFCIVAAVMISDIQAHLTWQKKE